MKQTVSITFAVLVVVISYTVADLYTFDYGPPAGNSFPFTRIQKLDRQGRTLQSLAGDSECFQNGKQYTCVADTKIQEEATDGANVTDGPFTEISVQVTCDFDSNIGYDFRKSEGCKCEAHIERITAEVDIEMPDLNPPSKVCPCLICAKGFGDVPVSIDCSMWENLTMKEYAQANDLPLINETTKEPINYTLPDPLITSECSALDCGLGCNGTCRLDCSVSDSSCEFCSNNPENQITEAPGTGGATDDSDKEDPLANFSAGAIVTVVGDVMVTMILAIVVAMGTISLA